MAMYERFTERAREVIQQARTTAEEQEADRITTGHLLIGMLREGEGLAAFVLAQLGLTVELLVGALPDGPTETLAERAGAANGIPFTVESKGALEQSLREALSLGHNYIGTEHLLLGIDGTPRSDAVDMLRAAGIRDGDIRRDTLRMLVGREQPSPKPKTYTASPLVCRNCGWRQNPLDLLLIRKGRLVSDVTCPNCGVTGTLIVVLGRDAAAVHDAVRSWRSRA